MTIDLDELERLANAATKGPWTVTGVVGGNDDIVWMDDAPDERASLTTEDTCNPEANALFIAAARDAVPALVAEVRWLRERIDNGPSCQAMESLRNERDALRVEVEQLRGALATIRDDLPAHAQLSLALLTDERDAMRTEVQRLRAGLKLARYDHVSDKALDSQRERYEKAQEEVEAIDKRLGAYFDDAISDIDQLRTERNEARRIALAYSDAMAERHADDLQFDGAAPDWLVKP